MGLASRMLRIRTGEGRVATSLVGLMFVSMAAIVIGESAIDALFFDRIGTDVLPQMYLLQGAVTFVAMLGLTWALGRIGGRRAYMLAPLALGAIVLAERIALVTDVRWIYPVMWVTVAIATLIQGIFLWGMAGAVVDTRQAKRLFPIFAAGGILGSVIGGLITRPLAAAIGAQNLLLVWAVALGVAFVLCRALLGPAQAGAHGHARREHVPALKGDGARVLVRPPVEAARVDDGRGGPVLRPLLVAVPPLRASRERPLPRRRPARRLLRPVRGGRHRGRLPRLDAAHEPAVRVVRRGGDGPGAPGAVRGGVRHPPRSDPGS